MKKELLEKLEERVWYRILKAISIILFILAFLGPWIIQKPSFYLFIDSSISVAIWIIIVFGLRRVVAYVVFGSQKSIKIGNQNIKLEKTLIKKVGLIILGVFSFIILIFSGLGIIEGIKMILANTMKQWVMYFLVVALFILSCYSIYRINEKYNKK